MRSQCPRKERSSSVVWLLRYQHGDCLHEGQGDTWRGYEGSKHGVERDPVVRPRRFSCLGEVHEFGDSSAGKIMYVCGIVTLDEHFEECYRIRTDDRIS